MLVPVELDSSLASQSLNLPARVPSSSLLQNQTRYSSKPPGRFHSDSSVHLSSTLGIAAAAAASSLAIYFLVTALIMQTLAAAPYSLSANSELLASLYWYSQLTLHYHSESFFSFQNYTPMASLIFFPDFPLHHSLPPYLL